MPPLGQRCLESPLPLTTIASLPRDWKSIPPAAIPLARRAKTPPLRWVEAWSRGWLCEKASKPPLGAVVRGWVHPGAANTGSVKRAREADAYCLPTPSLAPHLHPILSQYEGSCSGAQSGKLGTPAHKNAAPEAPFHVRSQERLWEDPHNAAGQDW